jgi:NADPH:quinone reductase-like Zn-dependent oxidoreductase
MKAWTIAKHGGFEGLACVDLPEPKAGADEVLIKVRAVSLNYRDLITVHNARPGNLPPPFVPCSDGAGEIVSVGSDVTRWKPGDRVAGIFFSDWIDGPFDLAYHKSALGGSAPGMLSEYAVLNEKSVVAVPDYLSWEDAACLPCAAVTVWQALFTRGGIIPGRTVLTLGTGGVSIFALQLAVAAGARVIVTSSSDEKLERARVLGAWETVNYKTNPDWDKEVWRLTAKRGADHVIELGGPGTLEKSVACVAAGGQVALIGVLTGFGPATASLFPLTARNGRIDGIYVGSRADFEALNIFLSRYSIKPQIDRVFEFADARSAFTHMESGVHFGKVVISL